MADVMSERPATHKELLLVQLEQQNALHEQIGRMERSMNKGFSDMKTTLGGLETKVAFIEGQMAADDKYDHLESWRRGNRIYIVAITISSILGILGLILSVIKLHG